ncbi:MAG TPA: selenocysteine-specific translation elongation factor [Gemmatimonadaceae bacterium]
MILGTAGHIDHGKTTLVHRLTGVDTDRLPEEKRRGITIELGFAPLDLGDAGVVGVVDVPGHEAFVRTMVAGATGIDLALLVVAADEGIMPQTREHIAILDLLNVHTGVIALTKVDLVDEEWLALVEEEVREATANTLPGAPIIATSAKTGSGVDNLRAALADALHHVAPRSDDDVFRLPVDRSFSVKGTGTVVTGTVWSGRLEKDDSVHILPTNAVARARGIQTHGRATHGAVPGARTAIALVGVEPADVPRGSVLVDDAAWRPTTRARADVSVLPGVAAGLRPRTKVRFHVGTSEVGARVVAKVVTEGEPFAARLSFDEPVVLRAGDRFVLRTTSPLNTIGGGVITDPYPPRRARPWEPGLSATARLERMVSEASTLGIELAELPVRLGLPARAVSEVIANTPSVELLGGRVASRAVLDALRAALASSVRDFHAAEPLEPGMAAQLLRSRLKGHPALVDAALEAEVRAGALVSAGGIVRLAQWQPQLDEAGQRLASALLGALDRAGIEPPTTEELSQELATPVAAVARYLERRGEIVQVEQNRYYTLKHLTLLIDRLRELLANGQEVNPSALREGLGISRKYLIPLLEYCDRVGHTVRGPAGRVWRGT